MCRAFASVDCDRIPGRDKKAASRTGYNRDRDFTHERSVCVALGVGGGRGSCLSILIAELLHSSSRRFPPTNSIAPLYYGDKIVELFFWSSRGWSVGPVVPASLHAGDFVLLIIIARY